ncbi:MAG TPA: MbtH family NRPS accessory protein [Pyrinomonadaceae bacterium]|jgi:MbtH protein
MSKRANDDKADDAIYKVVVNREDRYSIWPAHRENARGWKDAGMTGTKLVCQRFIDKAEKDKAVKRA